MAVISEGQVMNLGQDWGRSRLPRTMASIIDGWSDPTLTKHLVMPACRICSGERETKVRWRMAATDVPQSLEQGKRSRVSARGHSRISTHNPLSGYTQQLSDVAGARQATHDPEDFCVACVAMFATVEGAEVVAAVCLLAGEWRLGRRTVVGVLLDGKGRADTRICA